MIRALLKAGILVLLAATTSCAAGNPAMKDVDDAIDSFAAGCEQELSTYCKDVSPGDGRVLACLYAFGDKLSTRCEHALYDSMGKLDRALTNISYATGECGEDMIEFCSETVIGEGRVLECLKKNKTKVSKRCMTALKDVGWVE